MANSEAIPSSAKVRAGANATLVFRAASLLGLLIVELWSIAFLFRPAFPGDTAPPWSAVLFGLRHAFPRAYFSSEFLGLIFAHRWREIVAQWGSAAQRYEWRLWLGLNIALFVAIAAATPALDRDVTTPGADPWPWICVWLAAGMVMASALLLALAPAREWRRAFAREWPTLTVAVVLSVTIEVLATQAQRAWTELAFITFRLTASILSLYESDVAADPRDFVLRFDGFSVEIAKQCSGYEGIGLVVGFLLIYFWVFRRSLRFPNAYLLLPIGVSAIFVLNSVRIAALVSIGTHWSPELAVGGFHSRAGWLTFLVVTIGLMMLSHRSRFFFARRDTALAERRPSARLAAALLTPFIAAAAIGLAAAAFSSGPEWLYPLKVAAIALALWVYRTSTWQCLGGSPVSQSCLAAWSASFGS